MISLWQNRCIQHKNRGWHPSKSGMWIGILTLQNTSGNVILTFSLQEYAMIKRTKWNLIPIVGAILLLSMIITPLATAREETVSLTFKKITPAADEGTLYTVKAGESISKIIHDELGVSYGDIYRILDQVRELNPHIKNINIIQVGQKFLLPRGKKPIESEPLDNNIPETEVTTRVPIAPPGSESNLLAYTVKRGDSLSQIIHDELGVSYREMHTALQEVQKLNPHIGDINIIRPGDVLTLAVKGKETPVVQVALEEKPIIPLKEPAPAEKPVIPEKPFLSLKKELDAIGYIVGRMDGSVIREGTFYIPLPPAGQMSINCALVPIVELEEGMTMLLDFSNRIPDNLKEIIESTWKNYIFIRGKRDSEIPSMLEGVIEASRSYALKRLGDYKAIGNSPKINVMVDWVVSHEGSNPFAINLLKDQSSLLHKNVRNYAGRKGLEIVELVEEIGLTETDETSPPRIPINMTYETNLQLAESILSMLGYISVKDANIQIFDFEKDGFNLSIRTDLSLTIDGREILILFEKIPEQFLNTLKERGTTIATMSEDMGRETIVERTLQAVGTPFLNDIFSFPLSDGRGEILLRAIRAELKEDFLYFIDYYMDSEMCGLLYEKWEVKTVKY